MWPARPWLDARGSRGGPVDGYRWPARDLQREGHRGEREGNALAQCRRHQCPMTSAAAGGDQRTTARASARGRRAKLATYWLTQRARCRFGNAPTRRQDHSREQQILPQAAPARRSQRRARRRCNRLHGERRAAAQPPTCDERSRRDGIARVTRPSIITERRAPGSAAADWD
jgi:hypothetical protein